MNLELSASYRYLYSRSFEFIKRLFVLKHSREKCVHVFFKVNFEISSLFRIQIWLFKKLFDGGWSLINHITYFFLFSFNYQGIHIIMITAKRILRKILFNLDFFLLVFLAKSTSLLWWIIFLITFFTLIIFYVSHWRCVWIIWDSNLHNFSFSF